MPTSSRQRLSDLRGQDLAQLHSEGTCPEPTALSGVLDGAVLTGGLSIPGIRELRLWRGKAFDHDSDTVTGLNRLGAGPLEVRKYRFVARRAKSLFGDRDVVWLDHDRETNPGYVRRFHDELVQVDDGLYLATSHHRSGDDLRFLCYFALAER